MRLKRPFVVEVMFFYIGLLISLCNYFVLCSGKENAAYSLHNRHLEDRRVLELAARPALLGPLQGVLGPDVILLDSRFICKYPSEDDGKPDRYVAWHQDMR